MEDFFYVFIYHFILFYCTDLYRYGYETQVIKQYPQEELVTFLITFLRNTKYVKNPYLKAKFVEVSERISKCILVL